MKSKIMFVVGLVGLLMVLGTFALLAPPSTSVQRKAVAGSSMQIEAQRPTRDEFTQPGKESRKYKKGEVKSVTIVPDREWRLWLEDPLTKEVVDQGWKPTPIDENGNSQEPWNTVEKQFRSKSSFLKIEVFTKNK